MPTIVLDCPHCETQRVSMAVVARSITKNDKGIAFAQCTHCKLPVTALVQKSSGFKFAKMKDWVTTSHHADLLEDTGSAVCEIFPQPRPSIAPDHVPSDVARVYVQAENARKRKDNDAAGMAFRKVLDIGLKTYDTSLTGTLFQRIDDLAARHVITQSMKEWAHQVRLIGNEIAHEATAPTDADITALANFTETLLKYLFTLPEEVKQRKAATASVP